jgi:hypothetical protein
LEAQIKELRAFISNAQSLIEIENFEQVRESAASKILTEPFQQLERRKPFNRALAAFDSYDRRLDDLVRSLPETCPLNGPGTLAALGQFASTKQRSLARFRRRDFPLGLESILADEFRRLSVLRMPVEGEYLLSLLHGMRQLKENWEQVPAVIDSAVTGKSIDENDLKRSLARLESSTQALIGRAENSHQACRKWTEITREQLANRIVRSLLWRRAGSTAGAKEDRADYLNHQVAQLRAVDAEVGLERALVRVEKGILDQAQRALDSLDQEHNSLVNELDEFIEWLQEHLASGTPDDVPPAKTIIVPASSRVAGFEAGVKAELVNLPQSMKTPKTFSALPPRRKKIDEFSPRETLLQILSISGRLTVSEIFKDVELIHQKIIRAIEQVRDVVSFSIETTERETNLDPQVLTEALENALALLQFSRAEIPSWRDGAAVRFTRAIAYLFIENRAMLNRNRLGEFAYLARQGFRRAAIIGGRNAVDVTSLALEKALAGAQHLSIRFLVYIGWRQAPTAGKLDVITRPFLPAEFTTDFRTKDLPAIYRRLFRFEAVQDDRFLIGREKEMEAIGQARSFWYAGRPVAVIVVGQRGTGKTSLVNCAVRRSLEDLEILRGEFSERLLTEEQLRLFLTQMFGVKDTQTLEDFLGERRRVVIIEELERTFLRQVGHFGAIRALQRLIAATCGSTLWILVTNQVAFKFLNPALGLGQSFSHRINAASVSREALREAILLRHNLSGLRLQFALPPTPKGFVERVKNQLRPNPDPESVFFGALARESDGVFRTTFNIWLSQIDLIEAGVLYMKPLVNTDLSPVIDDLDLSDLFTLVAVMQHGSLTPAEHAIVFQKSLPASRAQIDELLAREIIESDPGRPGYRVRPEATRVVNEALYRRNLL